MATELLSLLHCPSYLLHFQMPYPHLTCVYEKDEWALPGDHNRSNLKLYLCPPPPHLNVSIAIPHHFLFFPYFRGLMPFAYCNEACVLHGSGAFAHCYLRSTSHIALRSSHSWVYRNFTAGGILQSVHLKAHLVGGERNLQAGHCRWQTGQCDRSRVALTAGVSVTQTGQSGCGQTVAGIHTTDRHIYVHGSQFRPRSPLSRNK
jgi:hypothetical protein